MTAAQRAHPFAALLGTQPVRLPKCTSAMVVVQGHKITDLRQVGTALLGFEADDGLADREVQRLRSEVQRTRAQMRYQRERLCPEKMAARDAWRRRNREQLREYKRAYDAAHRERIRQLQAAWARQHYVAHAEACRARARAYYAAHRERILAAKRAKAQAAKGGAWGERP